MRQIQKRNELINIKSFEMGKSKMNNDNDDINCDKIIIPMKKSIIEDNKNKKENY